MKAEEATAGVVVGGHWNLELARRGPKWVCGVVWSVCVRGIEQRELGWFEFAVAAELRQWRASLAFGSRREKGRGCWCALKAERRVACSAVTRWSGRPSVGAEGR